MSYLKEFSQLIQELTNDTSNNRKPTSWKNEFTQKFSENVTTQEKNDGPPHEILIANGVFISKNISIAPEFKSVVESFFQGTVKSYNFSDTIKTTKEINNWVSEKTKGMIPKHFSSSLNTATKLLVTSTLYFNAKWLDAFKIKQNDFYPNGYKKPSKKIDMLTVKEYFPMNFDSKCNCKVLGIPYQKNISTLYIFLPSDAENFDKFQKCLTADVIEKNIENLQKTEVEVWMPSFKIVQKTDLRQLLQQMNLTTLFDRNKTDLSLMYTEKDAQSGPKSAEDNLKTLNEMRSKPSEYVNADFAVSQIFHEVHLEVTEKGTKGAAVSSVMAMTPHKSKMLDLSMKFVVDIPFLFMIRHDPTKIPLFYGAMFDPIEMKS